MQEKQRKHGLIWFRNNLRIQDNTSLQQAMNTCNHVTAIYVFSPAQYATTPWRFPKTGDHRCGFLLETLKDLQSELSTLGIPLHLEMGRPEKAIPGA